MGSACSPNGGGAGLSPAVGREPDVEADDTAESLAAPPAEQTDGLLDEGIRWLTDLTEAQRLGMAIPIRCNPSSPVGSNDSSCSAPLVRRSRDGAALLGELLAAQRYTDGLALLSPGAPTNNTPAARRTSRPPARPGSTARPDPPYEDRIQSARPSPRPWASTRGLVRRRGGGPDRPSQ